MAVNDNLIIKKVLYAGSEPVQFKDGTKVHFHFQTRICDKEKTLLDDSRKMGSGKPMELVLGKKFKLEVWEAVVQRMALNEVAIFTIDKSLLYQYPFVSKALRDVHKPPHERKHHGCTMSMQTDGIGYADLNSFFRSPQNLEFTIELVKVEQPEEYERENWQLNENERIELVPKLKERGNQEYKNKNYKAASELYARALGIIEDLMLREKPHDIEWNQLNLQKVPLLLNFSQCVLNEGDYYATIEHCTSVLNIDKNNVKAYFRRGKGHIGAWNPDQARKDFQKAAELNPTLTSLIKKELENLEELVRLKNNEDKKQFKNLFT